MNADFRDPTRIEVWKTLRALNDCWTKGNPEDLRNYFHQDMVAITPTDRHRIEGGEACIRAWSNFVQAASLHRWQERDPSIQIYGNTAVVTYDFDMSFAMGGRTIDMSGRDMFVFVEERGRWWAVADQFSPYPPA